MTKFESIEEPKILKIFTDDVRKITLEILAQNDRILDQNRLILTTMLAPPLAFIPRSPDAPSSSGSPDG